MSEERRRKEKDGERVGRREDKDEGGEKEEGERWREGGKEGG